MARGGRLKLPAAVSSRLRLGVGERPLAWALGNGHWYVGTDRALHLSTVEGFRALGWERVERADWNEDTQVLAVVEVAGWGEPEPRTELELQDPGHLLELVRERVTKSVLVNAFAPVRGRLGLSVVGRQSPTGRGPVSWSYLLAAGLDPADPQVVEVAERTLAEAQSEVSHL